MPPESLPRRPVGKGREAGRGEQARRCAWPAPRAPWPNRREKKAIFSRTVRSGYRFRPEALRHIGDTGAHRAAVPGPGEIPTEQSDPVGARGAGLHPLRAGHDGEQGGFADPVRPDQADQPSGLEFEGHATQRSPFAVAMPDIGKDGDWLACAAHFPMTGCRATGHAVASSRT